MKPTQDDIIEAKEVYIQLPLERYIFSEVNVAYLKSVSIFE